jgi:thiol:disulfide interchange protein DsbD
VPTSNDKKMKMRHSSRLLPTLLALMTVLTVAAISVPSADAQGKPRVNIELIAADQAIEAGGEMWVALRQTIDPGWHTYWVNPGDSGEATTIEWQAPEGFRPGAINWPVPEAIPIGPLMNFGYSNEVLLLARLMVPKTAKPGPVSIVAKAEWLVCKDICIPEKGEARLEFTVVASAGERKPAPSAAAIVAAVERLPKPSQWQARIKAGPDAMTLEIDGIDKAMAKQHDAVRFLPLAWGQIVNAAPQVAEWSGDRLKIKLQRGDRKTEKLEMLEGVLVFESKGVPPTGYFLNAAIDGGTRAISPLANQTAPGPSGDPPLGLPVAVVFAFLGGLILNLMPCVFPVLSLKALAFAKPATDGKGHAAEGYAYLAGVLVCFGGLAIVLLALRGAGTALGWGFQFQSPAFVLILAALFLLLGLWMSGVFELGGSIQSLGDSLAHKPGVSGAFFTGALASIAATPCTAPFMASAVGYAVAQPAPVAFVVLLAMGLGFAAPMVALSRSSALQRILPRPGAWMETFKQALAFPLYATVAWLVWVLSLQAGPDGVMAAAVLLTGAGFLAWLMGRTPDMSFALRAAIVAVGLGLAVWSARMIGDGAPVNASTPTRDATRLGEVPFSNARLAELRAAGRPVFVNVTAAWCITCKVNEQWALSSSRVADAFKRANVAYLKGDWTRQDAEITAFLQRFGRAGVPLYLYYPADPKAEPRVLPQILTESLVLGEIGAAKTVN